MSNHGRHEYGPLWGYHVGIGVRSDGHDTTAGVNQLRSLVPVIRKKLSLVEFARKADDRLRQVFDSVDVETGHRTAMAYSRHNLT